MPGLYTECCDFLGQHGITDVKLFNKGQWKRLVRDKILQMNEDELIEQSQQYKKLDFTGEGFMRRNYIREMRIDEARSMFKLRSNMLPTVQMNFMSESEFAANLWTCSGCTRRDSQEHLLTCPGYADLRVGKNLEVDSDLVAYYRDIVKRRQD